MVGREVAHPPVFAVGVVALAGGGGSAAGAKVVAVEPAYAQSVAAQFAEAVGQVAKGIAGLARLSILPRIQ